MSAMRANVNCITNQNAQVNYGLSVWVSTYVAHKHRRQQTKHNITPSERRAATKGYNSKKNCLQSWKPGGGKWDRRRSRRSCPVTAELYSSVIPCIISPFVEFVK